MRGAAYLDASQAKRESVRLWREKNYQNCWLFFFLNQIEDVDLRAQTLKIN